VCENERDGFGYREFWIKVASADSISWICCFAPAALLAAKLANAIPGPKSYPFIGNANLICGLKSNHHLYKRAMKLSDKFGKVVRGWAGWKLIVFLLDPRDHEVILGSHIHIDKSEEYQFFEPWLGNGLLISTSEKWRTHRKLIAPAFHINVLKSFMGVFNENSQKVVKKLKEDAGREIDVHDQMSETTVDILLETAMGFKSTKGNSKSGYNYAMAVLQMCDVIHQRHFRLWYRLNAIFDRTKLRKIQDKALKIIHGLTQKVRQVETLQASRAQSFSESLESRAEDDTANLDRIINNSS
jgi:cytochrome P450 family 4